MSFERIFIIGGTGNIGTKVVNDLLDNRISVTLFSRNEDKVKSLFPHGGDLVHIVQGDYNNLDPIQEGIKGHTRLFLLCTEGANFAKTKETIARYAYAAGVKQIVDISSWAVNMGWRESHIGSFQYYGEKAIFDLPNRGYMVALRPARFMSNMAAHGRPIQDGGIYDNAEPDRPLGWISPNDIGAVAAIVLREDVCKHADAVYNLTGQVLTSNQRAEILSKVVDKQIPYIQVSATAKYNKIMEMRNFPHILALDLCDNLETMDLARVTPSIEILLGREPETLEAYLTANKHRIQ